MTMRQYITKSILFYYLLLGVTYGQFKTPVTVTAEIAAGAVRAGEVAMVTIQAAMDDEWHIYALKNAGSSPVATRVSVSGDLVTEQGQVEHRDPIEKFDEGFGVKTRFFQGSTEFRVPVLLKDSVAAGQGIVNAYILYQVCNESLCYPPAEVNIAVPLVIETGPPREDYTNFVAAAVEVSDYG